MPHLSGVFDEFADLERTSPEQLLSWLSQKPEIHFLVNFLGNRVLYPQTVPLTQKELEIDLALLKAGIKLKPGLVFQPQTNKIVIPKLFVDRFGPIIGLVKVIVEAINPKGVHIIYIKEKQGLAASKTMMKVAGSVISPLNPQKLSRDEKTVFFSTASVKKQLPLNAISIVRLPLSDTQINLGGEEYKAFGGEVGIIVDLRLGGFAG